MIDSRRLVARVVMAYYLALYLQILTDIEPGSGSPGRCLCSTFETQARLRPRRELYDPSLGMKAWEVLEMCCKLDARARPNMQWVVCRGLV